MSNNTQQKTHWLQSPNKNYLGHWDLPNGEDVILTIASAQYEEVKNPIINKSECKRVVRFKESYQWLKPFICNEVNAQSIYKSTDQKFMEDCVGKKIKIGIGSTTVKREEVECLRVRPVKQSLLQDKTLNPKQITTIQELLDKTESVSIEKICQSYQVDSLSKLPEVKFNQIVKRLTEIINNEDN